MTERSVTERRIVDLMKARHDHGWLRLEDYYERTWIHVEIRFLVAKLRRIRRQRGQKGNF